MFFGVAVLSPLVVGPHRRRAGRSASAARRSRPPGPRERHPQPRRTASTASALMIGLALVAMVTILGSSIKASATNDVLEADAEGRLPGERRGRIPALQPGRGGFAPEVQARSQAVAQFRSGVVGINGNATDIGAVDPTQIEAVADFPMSSGRPRRVGPDECSCTPRPRRTTGGTSAAWSRCSSPGRAKRPARRRDLFGQQTLCLCNYLITLDAYDANVEQPLDLNVFLQVADGVTVAEREDAARRGAAEGLPERAGRRPGCLEATVPRFGEPVARVRVRPAVPVDHHLRLRASWRPSGCRCSSASASSACSGRWAWRASRSSGWCGPRP